MNKELHLFRVILNPKDKCDDCRMMDLFFVLSRAHFDIMNNRLKQPAVSHERERDGGMFMGLSRADRLTNKQIKQLMTRVSACSICLDKNSFLQLLYYMLNTFTMQVILGSDHNISLIWARSV